MQDYSMWEDNPKAVSCSRTYSNVYFPYTGTYQIQISAANTATLSIDGTAVYTTPGSTSYTTAYTIDYVVSQGYHTVSFNATLSDQTIIGGVAIVISKSWSGATGGQAGPQGSSGGGGGSGGATTLVLNPKTANETLLAVAVGGSGGGGAGATTTGQSSATAPGPRGQTAAGISSPQTGQNQGDFYKDGGGGGAGGPGGTVAGRNGYSSEGDAYGQAGSIGTGYLNPVASGVVINPTSVAVAFTGPYYNLLPEIGQGASAGELQAKHGGAVFIFNSFGPRVKTAGGWQEVKTIFVNVNGEWKQIDGMYVNEDGVWEPVVGTFVPTFESQSDDYGILARPADHRPIPIPDPPAPPPPIVYDSIPRTCCCFVAGTQITIADGTIKSIEDVALGEVVLGKDGAHNTVLEFLRPTLGETGATIMAFNGGTPFMTSDHPVWVRGQGWKSFDPNMTYAKYKMTVGKYAVGDVVETQDGSGFEIDSIEEYTDQDPAQIIYNFALDGNNTYIADNLVVHNKGIAASNAGTCSTGSSASCSASGGGGGGGGGGGCCFIMLEARYGNGTMDSVVRRYRDEKMTDRNRRGYYRLAEVLVPLMRESRVFKFLVTKTFADPLVCYGKYYYGENRWGWIFKPVERFWMRVFDVVGGNTEFIRENGETV
jgi:Fe-S cluster assembly iron-binding protein IscA